MGIELTLLIDSDDIATFRRHVLLRRYGLAKSRSQQFSCTYFDTPDFQLKSHDAALRIERTADASVQILEGKGEFAAGIYRRQKWESKIVGPDIDFRAAAALPTNEPALSRLFLNEPLVVSLAPVFTSDGRRTIWQLRLDQGQQVELTLDQGELHAADASAPFSAVMFTLHSGEPGALLDLVLDLQQDIPLRMSNVDQAQTGYALQGVPFAAAVNAERFILPPDAGVEHGLQIIAGNCISHIQGNASGVMHSGDIECVHQMRVGLRRLRSALELFDDVKPCPQDIQTDLAWLTDQLGHARDWDVLGTATLEKLDGATVDASALDQLKKRAQQVAQGMRKEAAAAVDSARNAGLWLRLGRWLVEISGNHNASARSTESLSAPLTQFAARMLRHYQHKLQARSARIKRDNPRSRHRVRIAAKKLRYATEFFLSFYPTKSAHRFVARLSTLQDAFGASNDVVVANGLLRELAQKHSDLLESSAYVRGYLTACDISELAHLKKLAHRFAALKTPRQSISGH